MVGMLLDVVVLVLFVVLVFVRARWEFEGTEGIDEPGWGRPTGM